MFPFFPPGEVPPGELTVSLLNPVQPIQHPTVGLDDKCSAQQVYLERLHSELHGKALFVDDRILFFSRKKLLAEVATEWLPSSLAWLNMAPTPLSEVLVCIMNGYEKSGVRSTGAEQSNTFSFSNGHFTFSSPLHHIWLGVLGQVCQQGNVLAWFEMNFRW